MTNAVWAKVSSLREDFRIQVVKFLDSLDREQIPYCVGDALRTYEQEVAIWQVGRTLRDDCDPHHPDSWLVTGEIRTRVFPGSGKGPHPFGLAIDVYPKDTQTNQIMASTHPLFETTVAAMWRLAEEAGVDALGHKTDVPEDEYWSQDPCHFQLLGWRTKLMLPHLAPAVEA